MAAGKKKNPPKVSYQHAEEWRERETVCGTLSRLARFRTSGGGPRQWSLGGLGGSIARHSINPDGTDSLGIP